MDVVARVIPDLFVLQGRRMLREKYRDAWAGNDASTRDTVFPIALPTMAQFRTTRGIVGRAALGSGQHGQRAEDSIGLVADWRKPGFVWEVPFGTLVPRRVRGLLAAGRCISSCDDAWHVTRVIPAAALTGEAAGLAAALAVRADTTPDSLDPGEVQENLRRQGVPLHIEEAVPPRVH